MGLPGVGGVQASNLTVNRLLRALTSSSVGDAGISDDGSTVAVISGRAFNVVGNATVGGTIAGGSLRVGSPTVVTVAASFARGGAQVDIDTTAGDVTFEAVNRGALGAPVNLGFYARNGSLQFYNGAYVERMRVHVSGGISLLDATDPGAGVVRVAGALRVTGVLRIGANGSDNFTTILGYNNATSAIVSNVGFSASYNGMLLLTNVTDGGASYGASQGNTARSSWALDLGGADGVTFSGAADAVTFARRAPGGAWARVAWITSGGQIHAQNLIHTSDIRRKSALREIDDAIERLKGLTGYEYTMTDTNRREYGVVAQDVQGVAPLAVEVQSDGTLGVAYTRLIPLLINAVKNLAAEVEALRAA